MREGSPDEVAENEPPAAIGTPGSVSALPATEPAAARKRKNGTRERKPFECAKEKNRPGAGRCERPGCSQRLG